MEYEVTLLTELDLALMLALGLFVLDICFPSPTQGDTMFNKDDVRKAGSKFEDDMKARSASYWNIGIAVLCALLGGVFLGATLFCK